MPTNIDPISESHRGEAQARLRIAELRDRWGWFLALGIALIVLGTIALFNMLIATVASIYMVGLLMLIGAGAQIVHAFGVKGWGSFAWWMLGGVIYALAGLAAFINPLMASAVLTLLLAAALVATGAMRIWIGFKERPDPNWGWVVVSGAITLILGLMIAFGWPVNSLWVLGMFLAIDLLFQGWAMVAFGLALRRS